MEMAGQSRGFGPHRVTARAPRAGRLPIRSLVRGTAWPAANNFFRGKITGR
jgi:hypothetical protein